MKQKQVKGRHVSVHSSIAVASGPRPDVKVKKHFESTWKEKSKQYEPSVSKPVENLPCICEEQEEQELQQPSAAQKSRVKPKSQDDRKKWNRSRSQMPSPRGQKTSLPARRGKSGGEKQGLAKKPNQINISLPTRVAIASSSSHSTEQNKIKRPVSGSSEILRNVSEVRSREASQVEMDNQLYQYKVPNPSEVDMLYTDKPSYPSLSLTSVEGSDWRTLDHLTPSFVCKLLNKPYEHTLHRDMTSMAMKSKDSQENLGTYEVSYTGNFATNLAAKFPRPNETLSNHSVGRVYEKSNKNPEERTKQLKEIQTELRQWREKLSEKQTDYVPEHKSLSVNTVFSQTSISEKKTSDGQGTKKIIALLEHHQAVEEESLTGDSCTSQQSVITTPQQQ